LDAIVVVVVAQEFERLFATTVAFLAMLARASRRAAIQVRWQWYELVKGGGR
jgi:hypothetical protein